MEYDILPHFSTLVSVQWACYDICSLFFFLELDLQTSSSVFGFLMGCVNALLPCILLHFSVASCVLAGNFGDCFQALPELYASCSLSPRVLCCVVMSLFPWACPLTEPCFLMAASKRL
jgi:hypothetical protein